MKVYRIKVLVLSVVTSLFISTSFAWGKTGHNVVAEIAMHLVSDSTRAKVLSFLNGITSEGAANWMDSMRSNPDYDFMRPWHYLDFDKGQQYSRPPNYDNIVSRLSLCYDELKHYKLLCDEQVHFDLLCIFHLVGDLHQPLHTGYSEDKGGNTVTAYYLKTPSILHKIWDEQIIDSNHINIDSCLQWMNALDADSLQKIKRIDVVSWYNESRGLLGDVYDFPEFILDQNYIDKNKVVIEHRLLYAGIRLAAILESLFPQEPPNLLVAPQPLPNSISADSAVNYVGKKVTICTKVFSIKSLDNVSFIDVGAAFPKSPLTIVIFKKDRANFKPSIEQLYSGKYICIKGTVKLYNNKPEVIVTSPDDIIMQ